MRSFYEKYFLIIFVIVTLISIAVGYSYLNSQASKPADEQLEILQEIEQLILEDNSNLYKLEGVQVQMINSQITIEITEYPLTLTIVYDEEMNSVSRRVDDSRLGSTSAGLIVGCFSITILFHLMTWFVMAVIESAVNYTRRSE